MQRRMLIASFNFLRVKTQTCRLDLLKKLPELIGMLDSVTSNDRNSCVGNIVFTQQRNTLHDTLEGATILAVDTVRIVQICRPIDTNTNADAMFKNEVAPLLSDKRRIGLKRIANAHVLCVPFLLNLKRLPIKVN